MILSYSWILKHLLSRQEAPAKYPLLYSTGDRSITLVLFYLGNPLPSKVTSRLPVLHASESFAASHWKKSSWSSKSWLHLWYWAEDNICLLCILCKRARRISYGWCGLLNSDYSCPLKFTCKLISSTDPLVRS